MKTTELLAFLSRGYVLKSAPGEQAAALYSPAGEIAGEVRPEIIAKLVSDGLISLSAEEPRVYSLTAKARMLLSFPR